MSRVNAAKDGRATIANISLPTFVKCTRKGFLRVFLLDFCLFGGLIGIGIAELIIIGITKANPLLNKTSIPGWAILIAFGFSCMVGIIFGIFPAIKAARLDPIDALRHE